MIAVRKAMVAIMINCLWGCLFSPCGARAQTLGDFTYDSKGKRDPLLPWPAEESKRQEGIPVDEFRIEGIIYDPTKGSMAIVNGTVVKEGDELGAYRVSKIEKGVIYFSQKGKTIPVRLPSEEPSEEMPGEKQI